MGIYRNKTYVAFDGDTDIRYYYLMKAWKRSDNMEFDFHDAHDIRQSRESSTEETIKRNLRVRMQNTKMFVCLIGEHTRHLFRFVRWEIELAKEFGIPRIGCNLNGLRYMDDSRCPPALRESLCLYIPYQAAIVQHAIDNWCDEEARIMREGGTGAYYYLPEVYNRLGL